MKKLLLILLLIPFVLDAQETKVGVIVPLSGNFAKYGDKIREGIAKFSNLNISYLYEDEGCDPKKAMTSYIKLTNVDKVKLFSGPWCGSPQSVVAPLLKKNKQFSIIGGSASKDLYERSGKRFFSTQHSIEEESVFNAKKIYDLGAKKIVIVFFENEFSRAHEKAFRSEYKGKVLDTITYSYTDPSIFKSVALKIRKLNPDSVYFPDASPLLDGMLKEIKAIGLNDLKLFSVYSAQFDSVLTAVGEYGEGLIYSHPDIGEDNAVTHFSSLASKIISNLSSNCKTIDDKCVFDYLKNNYNFNSNGVLEGKLILKTIKNGKYVKFVE